MIYELYTPKKVNKDKKLNKFFIFLATLPIIFSILLGASAVDMLDTEPIPITDRTYKTIRPYKYYTIDELVVVGVCSYTDYLAFFLDGNGQRVYVLLKSYQLDDEMKSKCLAVKNDGFKVGDVVLGGNFTFSSYFFDSDKQYMNEAYGEVASLYPGIRLYSSVDYDSDESMASSIRSTTMDAYALISLVLLIVILSAMIIAYVLRQIKHLDKYLEAYNSVHKTPTQDQYF